MYLLTLSNLKEMLAERDIDLDHLTVHRWVICFSSKLLERFYRKKRQVTPKWNRGETYNKVKCGWLSLYRVSASSGDTVEFYFSEDNSLSTAKCFISKALAQHGRPERIVIYGNETNGIAIMQCDT